jgi:glycosyltransferase involved in cell wall biosynthesis
MRLVYVCLDPGIPTFGAKGASVHVQELLRAYRQLGHHVRLVTVRTGGTPPADLADVEVVELPRPRTRDVAAREQALLALDAEAERVIDGLADVEVVHERYSLWGGAGVRAARRRGLPGLLEVNAPLIDEQRVHRDLHHVEEAEARLVATVGAATAVAAVSEPVAAWVRDRVADAATTVVPNGVNTDRFHPPAAQPTRPFTVGFVGTLKPWHGVEALSRRSPCCATSAPTPGCCSSETGRGETTSSYWRLSGVCPARRPVRSRPRTCPRTCVPWTSPRRPTRRVMRRPTSRR